VPSEKKSKAKKSIIVAIYNNNNIKEEENIEHKIFLLREKASPLNHPIIVLTSE